MDPSLLCANQEKNRDGDHGDCKVQTLSKPLGLESHISNVILQK